MANIIHVALIVSCALVLYLRANSGIPDEQMLNVAIDLSGMVTGYVLFMCNLIDARKSGVTYKYYMYVLNVVMAGLYTDAMGWLLNGIASLSGIIMLAGTINSSCVPICACFFWLFATDGIRQKHRSLQILDKFIQAGMLLALILRFLNLFMGFYFMVDATGTYIRGPLYIVSLVYAYAAMIVTLTVITKERKVLKTYQIVAMYTYVLAPLIVGLITLMAYGLSVVFGVIMATMLLMYCVFNVDQSRERAVAERDLETATAIQKGVLPREFPPYPDREEFDLYATMDPAREVGGDFYDFFFIDKNRLVLTIADVSGKGVAAALVMMITKALLKNRMLDGDSPAEALYNVNNQLLESRDSEMFVTVWMAVIDVSTGEGIAVNAGHEHPILRRAGAKYEYIRYKHSIAIAAMEDMQFSEHAFQMGPGDSLFVYTDGAPEAIDSEMEMFGEDRLLEALNLQPDAQPQETLRSVTGAIEDFVVEAEQFDDITMLCFKYYGPADGQDI
ncbi:MAG: PP2C family protein-serine/threonine phosphatase [Bacillota bacterium]|nr:PP2C family protein-serine/threonine phosphatase [Bacillota bacterium]